MNYPTSSVRKTIDAYLTKTGQRDTPILGREIDHAAIKDAAPSLLSQLQKSQASAGLIIFIAVGLLCALFVVGVALIFYYRNSPGTIALIFGGNFFSLLIIVFWLRRLWLEKTTIDTLMVLVSGMSTAEAAKVIVGFHFKAIKMTAGTP